MISWKDYFIKVFNFTAETIGYKIYCVGDLPRHTDKTYTKVFKVDRTFLVGNIISTAAKTTVYDMYELDTISRHLFEVRVEDVSFSFDKETSTLTFTITVGRYNRKGVEKYGVKRK